MSETTTAAHTFEEKVALIEELRELTGKVLVDHRGLRFRMDRLTNSAASRVYPACVELRGRVIDSGPLYDASASIILLYVGSPIPTPVV